MTLQSSAWTLSENRTYVQTVSIHLILECLSRKVCKICHRKHHTLLHLDPPKLDKFCSGVNLRQHGSNELQKSESTQATTSLPEKARHKGSVSKVGIVILPSAGTKFLSKQMQGTLTRHLRPSYVRRHWFSTSKLSNPIVLAVAGVKALESRQYGLVLKSPFHSSNWSRSCSK